MKLAKQTPLFSASHQHDISDPPGQAIAWPSFTRHAPLSNGMVQL